MSIRTENLKPWKPGQSGNPGGRPRKKLVDRALEELLTDNSSQKAREVAEKVVELALKGDIAAIRLIAERTEGRPLQKVELGGESSGTPPSISVQFVNPEK